MSNVFFLDSIIPTKQKCNIRTFVKASINYLEYLQLKSKVFYRDREKSVFSKTCFHSKIFDRHFLSISIGDHRLIATSRLDVYTLYVV